VGGRFQRLQSRKVSRSVTRPPAEFSAVIPVRDDPVRLERLLRGLREHAPAGLLREIIVVDDGSAEPPEAVCARHGAVMLRVVPGRGPAHARNVGAAAAAGTHLFFFDADVVYAPGVLEKAAALFAADPELGAACFFNQRYDAADNAVRNFGAALEHYWFRAYLVDGGDTGPLSGFTTRNGAIRRGVFAELGGFSEDFDTNAGEDYDFGKRLIRDHRSMITASPVLYHAFPDRSPRLFRNYFVRTALFVPYFLRHRPPLDKSQTSGGEALLRLAGVGAAGMVPLVFLPVVGGYAGAAFLVLAVLYTASLSDFLRAAWRWCGEGRPKAFELTGEPDADVRREIRQGGGPCLRFAAACLLIHWASSCVITAGGLWGLARHLLSRRGTAAAAGGAP
jgi:glycosyltransferase involved in cell wall biosynthesis